MKYRMCLVIAAISGMVFLFSGTALAGSMAHRHVHQQARIYQGIRSGALTPGETIRLERQQCRIQGLEMHALSDGKLTKRERLRINRAQVHASRSIYRLKHNNRSR